MAFRVVYRRANTGFNMPEMNESFDAVVSSLH